MSERTSSEQPQQPDPVQEAMDVASTLAASQAELERYQALLALPGLSPEAAHWLSGQVRSARAAVKLGQKALRFQEQQQDQQEDPNVLSLLRLSPPLLQGPLTQSPAPNPGSPTKPATSG